MQKKLSILVRKVKAKAGVVPGRGGVRKKLIISDPALMMGKPVIAGTQITVELILEKLAAGETVEEILEAHPRLTRHAIQAALEFAAEALRSDVVYPVTEVAR